MQGQIPENTTTSPSLCAAAPVGLLNVPITLPSPWEKGRTHRVVWLVLAIALMSLGDLWMTLTYLHTVGMGEANPVARWFIAHNSPGLLAGWKLASVVFGCLILLWARRSRTGELGAWVCFVALAMLTCHWINFSAEISEITPVLDQLATAGGTSWVAFE